MDDKKKELDAEFQRGFVLGADYEGVSHLAFAVRMLKLMDTRAKDTDDKLKVSLYDKWYPFVLSKVDIIRRMQGSEHIKSLSIEDLCYAQTFIRGYHYGVELPRSSQANRDWFLEQIYCHTNP